VDRVEPLIELFDVMDRRLEHFEKTRWGTIAADSRIPLIYDANYASVETDAGGLSLADIEEALLPALERAGASHVHVGVWSQADGGRLLEELEASDGKLTVDTVMRFEAEHPLPLSLSVDELQPSEDLWALQRRAMREFDITEPEVIEQLVWWRRELMAPAGKRWFTTVLDDHPAGVGSLFVADGAALVDDVVTFPEARRRGVATAIVSHMVSEARRAGARDVYLLADAPDPIRMYERLGFEAVGEIADWLRPREAS
jgi:GNAT superfamily N-acetyltransferase